MSDKEIEIIYRLDKESPNIFGIDFVKSNKKNCKIIYKDKEYLLTGNFNNIDNDYKDKDVISLKLKFINDIIDMSYMFCGCNSLISLSDISRLDTSKVEDMGGLFSHCSSLKSLPDISGLNTSNVEFFGFMFTGCYSLISLPDISKWNTSNIKNMNNMFDE